MRNPETALHNHLSVIRERRLDDIEAFVYPGWQFFPFQHF
jgi:hypothetical protein